MTHEATPDQAAPCASALRIKGAASLYKKLLITTITCFMAASPAHGLLLDWDLLTWTPGATNTTYSNLNGSGIDVTISLSITGAAFIPYNGIDGPSINNRLGGDAGGNPGGDHTDALGNASPDSLFLHMDATSDNRLNSYIDVSISFTRNGSGVGVRGVNFSLFDIDRGSGTSPNYTFDDTIERISGSLAGQSVAATVSGGSGIITTPNQATGTPGITTTTYTGNINSADLPSSVLNVGWGTQFVDTVSFRYSSGDRAQGNPTAQGISLSDIAFYPVPEASTWTAGIALSALCAAYALRRKKATAEEKDPQIAS
jgi:hypothetical protein